MNTTNISEIFLNEDDPDSLTKNQHQVHNHVFKFYDNLFAHQPTIQSLKELKNFTHDCNIPQVTELENKILEAQITTDEIAQFIKHMNNDKSPGFTGITPAFYKVFWHKLKTLVTNAIQDCLEKDHLPIRQRIGLVTLIPKQDKDTRHVGNLRPITLLSTFYKIISGTITNRLKPILNRLIQPWQKAYLQDRYIGDITRNTFDLFSKAKTDNIPGLMLQIDFSKAFDSISFEYIENALKIFNFNQKTISWINTLLLNFQSSILINGTPTPRINVGRGCRQGDPIAGYLFILCVEILLLKLSKSTSIIPWTSKNGTTKLLDAYADDINIFIKYTNPTTQINAILKIMTEFKKLSGLSINVSKTKYALFGNAKDCPSITQNTLVEREKKPFRLLGIILTGDLNELQINWDKTLDSARLEAYQWIPLQQRLT